MACFNLSGPLIICIMQIIKGPDKLKHAMFFSEFGVALFIYLFNWLSCNEYEYLSVMQHD